MPEGSENKVEFEKVPLAPEIANEAKKEIIAVAKEVAEKGEVFPFPGLKEGVYEKIKGEDELYPGMTTPIDEIIGRMKVEGIKVVLDQRPESGNVYVLPAQSNDVFMDSLLIDRLLIVDSMSDDLKRLILET